MEVKLFIGQKKEVVLAFGEPLESVPQALYFDSKSGLFYVCMPDMERIFELDCAVYGEAADAVQEQSFCHVGFFQNGQMKSAATLPLLHEKSIFTKKYIKESPYA